MVGGRAPGVPAPPIAALLCVESSGAREYVSADTV